MANILLAEDDASMRAFIAGALEKAGHKVRTEGDGLTALAALKTDGAAYDLLLTDIVMPGMDGIELSAQATSLMPGIKIMFITGFAAMASRGAQEGGRRARLLSKPFHLGTLVEEVNKLLVQV